MTTSRALGIQFLFLIAGIALITLAYREPGEMQESKPRLTPPKYLVNFTFGFKNVIADSLWLRVLQADDFCESERQKSSFNGALLVEDILKFKLSPSRCHKGWVYQMYDLITDLDPQFAWVYRLGGVQLSIAVDDREGARLIFEKGIKYFPEDWSLLYRAAYHLIFEVQDGKRAAEVLAMATKLPDAPMIVHLLASKLLSVTGQAELGRQVLVDYLKSAKEGSEGYHRAKNRLEEMDKLIKKHQ